MSISLSVTYNRTSGWAPFTVFAHTIGTTSTFTSRPYHKIFYKWTLTGAGGAAWSYGSRPGINARDTAYGPMAIFCLETPGSYTLELVAFDGDTAATTSQTITVTDPNTVFSGANTVAVANGTLPVAGVDGVPAGATCQNQSNLGTISGYATDGKRILLKHDDTWSTGTLSLNDVGSTGGIIGKYGTGADPIISGQSIVLSGSGTPTFANWAIMDIELDGVSGTGTGIAMNVGSADFITMLRLYIHDYDAAVNFGRVNIAGHHVSDSLSIVDCRLVPNTTFAWIGDIFRFGNIGSEHADVATGSHTCRLGFWNKVLLSNNDYRNGGDTLTLRAPDYTASDNTLPLNSISQYGQITDNYFAGGANTASSAPLGSLTPVDAAHDMRVQDVIMERNYGLGNSANCGGLIKWNATQITMQNNIMDVTSSTVGPTNSFGGQLGIEPAARGINSYHNAWVSNTAHSGGNAFTGLRFNSSCTNNGGADPNNAKNELVYAPNSTAPTEITDASGSATLSNNTTDAVTQNPNFATFPWTSAASIVTSGGYTAAAGVDSGVYTDFFLRSRYGVTPDIGPYQQTEGTSPWESAAAEGIALFESSWYPIQSQTNPLTISKW